MKDLLGTVLESALHLLTLLSWPARWTPALVGVALAGVGAAVGNPAVVTVGAVLVLVGFMRRPARC
ncbi:hypothetical protein K7W42_07875 [Deinococcus sp. HMF7604]|uniref:hypothetical protein n=1 Tax=Deinococcus betulae TaxID=2873312 RepID=UPI001CCEE1F6|nr:hypothetical protein [Deinococcus betulae]MBZ9750778.1 hypothetical protein [Deinococcus betulae]